MTHRKTREARERATEDAVFGYRAPSSGRRMMANSDEPDDDGDDRLLTDDALDEEPTYSEARTMKITVGELRKVIREEADNAFALGLKPTTLDVVKKKWPDFYTYLEAYYREFLPRSKVAIKKTGVFGGDPWVLIPDRNRTVVSYNTKLGKWVHSSSETAAAALAAL